MRSCFEVVVVRLQMTRFARELKVANFKLQIDLPHLSNRVVSTGFEVLFFIGILSVKDWV